MMTSLLRHQMFKTYYKPLSVLLLAAAGMSSITISYAATYSIDPTHANVRFAIDHFGTSTNTGGFYNLTGQLDYDPQAKTGNIALIIPMNTLVTGNTAFDIVLKSEDFFDIEKYPAAYFNSSKWYFSDDSSESEVVRVDGNLTLRGQTHPVTLIATKFNCYLSPILKGRVCGGDFTTTIDRTKWGISKYTLLGMTEKVDLNIQIEAAKQ